jgi:hypothetical protein
MPDRNRVDRGKATQLVVARAYQAHGWEYAQAVGGGRAGRDVTGLPGLFCEVKAERGWRPTTWLRQHSVIAGVPLFVVQRPDGYGPANVAEWPVVMRWDHHTQLLQAAGYGAGGTRLDVLPHLDSRDGEADSWADLVTRSLSSRRVS